MKKLFAFLLLSVSIGAFTYPFQSGGVLDVNMINAILGMEIPDRTDYVEESLEIRAYSSIDGLAVTGPSSPKIGSTTTGEENRIGYYRDGDLAYVDFSLLELEKTGNNSGPDRSVYLFKLPDGLVLADDVLTSSVAPNLPNNIGRTTYYNNAWRQNLNDVFIEGALGNCQASWHNTSEVTNGGSSKSRGVLVPYDSQHLICIVLYNRGSESTPQFLGGAIGEDFYRIPNAASDSTRDVGYGGTYTVKVKGRDIDGDGNLEEIFSPRKTVKDLIEDLGYTF